MELAIARSSSEDETAGRDQHRAPVRRLTVVMRPHALTGIDVPRLHLAKVIGAGRCESPETAYTHVGSAGSVNSLHTCARSTEVVVGRHIDHARLGAERNRRPVLAAVRVRAVFSLFAGPGLASRIDIGPTGLRVQASKHVLVHIPLPVDETNRSGAPLQEPEIAVAGDVDQALDRPFTAA